MQAPVQVFGKGGNQDVRANKKRNDRPGSENVSNGPADEGGEGAKVGLPVI